MAERWNEQAWPKDAYCAPVPGKPELKIVVGRWGTSNDDPQIYCGVYDEAGNDQVFGVEMAAAEPMAECLAAYLGKGLVNGIEVKLLDKLRGHDQLKKAALRLSDLGADELHDPNEGGHSYIFGILSLLLLNLGSK